MIGRLAAVLVGGAVLVLVSAGPAAAQSKCAGSKIKAACKKTKCLLGLEAKECQSGTAPDPAKVQKCRDKYAQAFAKLEAKGGCLTTGDAQDVEDKVDAFITDVTGELCVGPPDKCSASKVKASAKKACCLLGLEAKQATQGGAIDAAKAQKCRDKHAQTFAKADAKGGCDTTGDAQDLEDKVDAFIADAVAELDPAPTTTTTTTVTTTTGASTTTTTNPPGVELQGALPPTLGRFNYNMTLGLPGANAACNTNFPGTHACEYSELQAAEAAGDLVGLTDTNSNPVTRFWAIDPLAPILQQCNDDQVGGSDLNWEYGTADTPSRGQRVTLNNGTGALGALQTGVQCNIAGSSSVGCCL
jgi:hypothetical protein